MPRRLRHMDDKQPYSEANRSPVRLSRYLADVTEEDTAQFAHDFLPFTSLLRCLRPL